MNDFSLESPLAFAVIATLIANLLWKLLANGFNSVLNTVSAKHKEKMQRRAAEEDARITMLTTYPEMIPFEIMAVSERKLNSIMYWLFATFIAVGIQHSTNQILAVSGGSVMVVLLLMATSENIEYVKKSTTLSKAQTAILRKQSEP